jgi:hypothetical protein
MSGEIQGDASLDVQQVLAGLRQLQTGITGVTNGMMRLNTEGDKAKRTLKDTFKDSAQAASKAGGPLGSWTSKLFGGASMGDGFGRIAVGLTLAAAGAKMFTGQVERAVAQSLLLLKVQRDLREDAARANNELNSMAARGEKQAGGLVPMVAVGGKNAMDDLSMVTSTGVDQGSAAKGIAALYGRFGDSERAKRAVDIAMRGEMGGLPFEEVADELTRHGGAIDDSTQSDRLLGRLAMKKTGTRGNPEEIWAERMKNLDSNAFIKKAREDQGKRSVVDEKEREAFMGRSPVGQDLRAADPVSAAANERYKRDEQEMADLATVGKAAREAVGGLGILVEWAKNLGLLFGGDGSLQNQLEAAQRRRAEALGVAPPPDPVKPVNFTSGRFIQFGR